MNLSAKMALMEKKIYCLKKIKEELSSQLISSNEHINSLEKEIGDLKNTNHTCKREKNSFSKSIITNFKLGKALKNISS